MPVSKTALSAATAALMVMSVSACTPAAQEKVTIDYMHRLPDEVNGVAPQQIIDRWNSENPDIQVKATKFDGKPFDMILKLETDVNAGVGPCLAQTGYAETPQLFAKGLLEDVTEQTAEYKEKYSEGAFASMTMGETAVGLPQDTGPLVYFYNKTAFDDLGIEVPTTLEELTAASAAAAEKGKFATAFTPDEARDWLSAQAAAAGDSWFTTEGDAWKVDTQGPGTTRVAEFWQGLIDDKQTLTTERWGEEFAAELNSGTLIGHVGAGWEAGLIADALSGTDQNGQWRVAQLPDFGAGAVTGPDGGSGVSVMKDCENPEESLEFLDWFNHQTDELAAMGLVSATTTDAKTPEAMKSFYGGQEVVTELTTATGNLSPTFTFAPGFPTLSSMVQPAAAAADGKGRVDDVFTTADETATAAIEDLGLPVAR